MKAKELGKASRGGAFPCWTGISLGQYLPDTGFWF